MRTVATSYMEGNLLQESDALLIEGKHFAKVDPIASRQTTSRISYTLHATRGAGLPKLKQMVVDKSVPSSV